ncbi:hypothetical protein [Blastococcus sp. CT_GayMR16]|uniref:hypothetical protein n=1 Tax=Blastococcus sp. CT_GayMR16 TaxID=2559607 RepID=UPI001073713E|nr:hypothetical protein [Blastococcus sp. CT_GayMR16]TFV89588.1 hypothetical protein E4P38_07460 [Blastococcus sp. CT_GayMR16]
MTRAVVIRVLDRQWIPLQVAERAMRQQAEELRAERETQDVSLRPAVNADIAQVLAAATQVRAMWTAQEREVDLDDIDGLWDPMIDQFGSLPPLAEVLPEQGFRLCGTRVAVFLRFADSTSTEDPEVVWVDEFSA